MIPRIFKIWTRAKNIKNSFAPINRLPPEILALVAGFLRPELQLINATAVCQHWRTTLLSFPRLWSRVRSPYRPLFDIYLERSKSAPLQVQLHDLRGNLRGNLFDSLAPHASRLASLCVWMRNSSDFHLIARYLPAPIPTLREFSITTDAEEYALEVPSGISNDHFSHVRKLCLEDISSLKAPHAFPHVTELVWIVKSHDETPIAGLLDTMGQLPELERVEITFRASPRNHNAEPVPQVVTLPHLQRMSLRRCSERIPHILEFLKLPNLASLDVDVLWRSSQPFPVLPVTSFDENLPNFSELTEIEVRSHDRPRRVIFRSPRGVLECHPIGQASEEQPYHYDRKLFGGLPLRSVRKLIVILDKWAYAPEVAWVVCLMRDLGSLEDLELWGQCGYLLRYLRRMVMQEYPLPRIKTLTVYYGATGVLQVLRLKEVVDGLGLGIIMTCIPDPEVPDDDDWYGDDSSEDWNWVEDQGGDGNQD